MPRWFTLSLRRRSAAIAALLAAVAALPAARADDMLLPAGSRWKYLDDGSNQGTAWTAPAFNDASWASGPAQLGYGDGDEATVVSFGPNPSNKYVTTYFRCSFTATNPGQYLNLALSILRDDGAIVYLNGVEVARANMSAGAFHYQTLAPHAIDSEGEDLFKLIPVSPSLLVTGSNCLAVEIHQSSVTSSDISFDLELVGETLLKVARGPYLQLGTPQGVTVCWRTNGPTDGRVRYGSAPGSLNLFADDPVVQNDHQVPIAGLAPGATYYYSIGTTSTVLAGGDAEHRFVTAPPTGTEQPVRVWVLGDSGTADSHAAAVRDAYLAHTGATPTDLWLMLGDNAYYLGSDSEYQAAVFDTYPQLLRKSVLWPTRGNHEKDAAVHYGIFALPAQGEAGGVPSGTEAYFSFDYANVHFICLDSTGSDRSAGGPMWNWLASDLAATTQHWIIAFFHHPPYTKGSHDSDTETTLIEMRQNFLPLLEAGGVDLVLAGHSHAYERSYFIDGHYGLSTTFAPAHLKDAGNGSEAGDGPYVKAAMPHAGAVHAVVGCSGKISSGPLNHPAMYTSLLTYGSAVLDIDRDRLDVRFLDDQGQVLDEFTLRSFPDAGLTGDTTALSASAGGTQSLDLHCGAGNAGKAYFLVGSMSGTEPGLPVGAVTLPLVPDWYMVVTIQAANSTVFSNTFSALDGAGAAAAAVNLAPGLAASFVGTTLCHAYVVFDPPPTNTASFASNPFPLTLLP